MSEDLPCLFCQGKDGHHFVCEEALMIMNKENDSLRAELAQEKKRAAAYREVALFHYRGDYPILPKIDAEAKKLMEER